MRKLMKSRIIRVFFLWYGCLFIIAASVVTAIYIREIRQEKDAYIISIEKETQHILNYFSQSFTASVDTCNSIFTSRWYMHYRNVANIYIDEFDGMKKMEILQDIASKVTALTFVTDILIITPPPINSIISKNGWFTFDEYDRIYGLVDIALPEDNEYLPVVTAADQSICTITLPDISNRRIQSVICIIVDKKLFADTLERIFPERATYVRAELCDQILYEKGQMVDGFEVSTAFIHRPDFSITLAFPNYEASLMKAQITSYILIMMIVILTGAIFSALITMIVIKPLSQIIKRFGGNFHQLDDPYCFISEYVETFTEHNKQLFLEKENLNKSMERFLSIMRDEILFGMLTNPHFNFHDEYSYTSIPWINDGYPYVLVLIEPKFQGESELPTLSDINNLAEYALYFCTFSILYNDLCILFWFKDLYTANEQYNRIKSLLSELSNGKYFFSISGILQDTKSMGERYLMQKSEIADQRHTQLDLPISFQIELISKLQSNKQEECEELLYRSKTMHNPNAIMQLLVRIASKYHIEPEEVIDQYYQCNKESHENKQWDVLINFASELCKTINDVKNVSIDETAEIIRKYIDEHYCDPNLCMKQLSDHFSMHRTLISKILKEHLGVTFSEYLLDLRIKKSMELLKSTEMNIYEVGEAVGYENYISFKRAFLRYKGISPREFRIQFL